MKGQPSLFKRFWGWVKEVNTLLKIAAAFGVSWATLGGYVNAVIPRWYSDLVSSGYAAHGAKFFLLAPLLPQFLLLAFLLLVFVQGCYRDAHGKVCGRPRLLFFLMISNPVQWWKVMKKIHDFQHDYELGVAGSIGLTSVQDVKLVDATSRLLQHVQQAIEAITGAEVAVHIKLFFTKDGTSSDRPRSHSEAVLRTYFRVPTRKEELQAKHDDKRLRRNQPFQIILEPGGKGAVLHASRAAGSAIGDKGLKNNSAYNYCFSAGQHYWVNNDLRRAYNEKKFFSDSDRWEEFYNSLAVIVINKHDRMQTGLFDRSEPCPVGLLILDSPASGAFDRYIVPRVAGYFAHRFHQFFLHAESAISNQKNRQKTSAISPKVQRQKRSEKGKVS